jgi:hypothetical protein
MQQNIRILSYSAVNFIEDFYYRRNKAASCAFFVVWLVKKYYYQLFRFMKIYLLFVVGLLFISAQNVTGQEFRKFRVAIGGGYAIAAGDASGGLFGTVEPGYRVMDKILVGLRWELAGIARGGFEDLTVDVDISKITSVGVNAAYYFKNDGARPFAGFGVGSYSLSSIEYRVGAGGSAEETGNDSKIGFYPRVGIDLGHLIFAIDYNVIPKTTGPDKAEFKNNYLAFRLGIFFGGGRN